MGVVGALALAANAGVAGMFWRFRDADTNMRSVWICSRNDAIDNLAVLVAALGVFGTGTGWPDIAVAAIIGGLSLHGGWQIVHHAWPEQQGNELPGSASVWPAAGQDFRYGGRRYGYDRSNGMKLLILKAYRRSTQAVTPTRQPARQAWPTSSALRSFLCASDCPT
ncbi:hypothetical protein [Gluconacetobacter dulcium]|uniref:hypothetical protein n=1 Tax=Gluconacetobacter dulcium TaxID=2729096 RepID=UPI002180C372|nr:hypothetical protein [Gluconacetobacter dulcium]